MKINLAENMLRFGVKNLNETAKHKVKVLAEQASQTQAPTAAPTAAPTDAPTLTLNYTNGLFRLNEFFTNDSQYMYWDTNATFVGGPGTLTISEIICKPVDNEAAAKLGITPQTPPVVIKLVKPFTVKVPIDYKMYQQISTTFFNSIKLNLDAKTIAALKVPNAKYINSNTVGSNLFTALNNYCVRLGYYTGPKKPKANKVVFINHDGQEVTA